MIPATDISSPGTPAASTDAGGAECKTKARIVAVAERMIAERGVQQFSIRDITGEAGVNLAAINYHFGSKERLIAEVLARRITALNAERMALLDKLEADATAAGKPVKVEAIVEMLVNTMLPADEKERVRSTHTIKMLSRMSIDPDEEIVRMFTPHFRPLKERIVAMLARALPHLKRGEVEWRASRVFGLVGHHVLFEELHSKERGKKSDLKKEQSRLLAFCVAGLRMPSETQAK